MSFIFSWFFNRSSCLQPQERPSLEGEVERSAGNHCISTPNTHGSWLVSRIDPANGGFSFPRHLGTASFVQALLQGSSPALRQGALFEEATFPKNPWPIYIYIYADFPIMWSTFMSGRRHSRGQAPHPSFENSLAGRCALLLRMVAEPGPSVNWAGPI